MGKEKILESYQNRETNDLLTTWFEMNHTFILSGICVLLLLLLLLISLLYIEKSYRTHKAEKHRKLVGYIYPGDKGLFIVRTVSQKEYSSADIRQLEMWDGQNYTMERDLELISSVKCGTQVRVTLR